MPEVAATSQKEAFAQEDLPGWARVRNLVCELTVELPLPNTTVRDLTRMEKGWVIDSRWAVGADVPMRINEVLIAWGEFEVVAGRLALRITELAQPQPG